MISSDRIQIELRKEGMEAWAKLSAGERCDRGVIRDWLSEAGIIFGIDQGIVDQLEEQLGKTTGAAGESRVAVGVAPMPGEPERLALTHVSSLQPGTLRADGSLDYRERQLIIPVEKGDELGLISPSREGKPGMNVLGEAVPAEEPAPPTYKFGEGVIRDAEGVLRAAQSGARTLAPDGTLDVVDRHIHPGNVNLASGSLRSQGSLEIGRDVEIGMVVEATGDIAIKGTVDGAHIRAEGSIQIGSGAIGRETGSVSAGGDIEVRHALSVSLFAKGILRVARSVSASRLTAHAVEVGGRLLGDSVRAESRILVAGEAGSPGGGPCWLRVAYPLDETGAGGLEKTKAPSLKSVSPLGARKGRGGGKDGGRMIPRRGERAQAATGANSAMSSKQDLEARIAWRRRQRTLQATAVIEVRGKAYAGCRIDFGGKPQVLEHNMGPCCFRFDPETNSILRTEI